MEPWKARVCGLVIGWDPNNVDDLYFTPFVEKLSEIADEIVYNDLVWQHALSK